MTENKKPTDESLPVEVVGRRLACQNSKFHIYFDHVIDRAGSEVREYLVVAPKHVMKNLVAGVAILPIADGQVGLVRIYRPAIQGYSWEIPHGFLDEGEDEKTSALRELQEETGLAGKPENLTSLGFITPDSGVLAARVHLYLAEACVATRKKQHELGLREFRLFPFGELESLIERSEIQDTFTLAALCKYQVLHNSRRNCSKTP